MRDPALAHACFPYAGLLVLCRDSANLLVRDLLVSVLRVCVGAPFREQRFIILRLELFVAERAFGNAHGGSFRLENIVSSV